MSIDAPDDEAFEPVDPDEIARLDANAQRDDRHARPANGGRDASGSALLEASTLLDEVGDDPGPTPGDLADARPYLSGEDLADGGDDTDPMDPPDAGRSFDQDDDLGATDDTGDLEEAADRDEDADRGPFDLAIDLSGGRLTPAEDAPAAGELRDRLASLQTDLRDMLFGSLDDVEGRFGNLLEDMHERLEESERLRRERTVLTVETLQTAATTLGDLEARLEDEAAARVALREQVEEALRQREEEAAELRREVERAREELEELRGTLGSVDEGEDGARDG